jgi:hypothetical protein
MTNILALEEEKRKRLHFSHLAYIAIFLPARHFLFSLPAHV